MIARVVVPPQRLGEGLFTGRMAGLGGLMTPAPTMRGIFAAVAKKHGLTVDELRSKCRSRRIAWARQEAIWEMRQVRRPDGEHRYSLPKIGEFVGGFDHTTCLHAVKAHEARRVHAAASRKAA